MSQKILCLGTAKPILRDLIKKSWSEDAGLFKVNPLTGLDNTPPCTFFTSYSSVLGAMNAGWTLMAPPIKDGFFIAEQGPDYGTNTALWSWWLMKEETSLQESIRTDIESVRKQMDKCCAACAVSIESLGDFIREELKGKTSQDNKQSE